ncbi:unnamed protein product [Rotaria socialis]|uniref:Protein translocase subunit SecA n=1 Tax=Rotaria socialis TaxID=392032 RepID=A0A818EPH4_9BILA|nr:unnamed protein product [Rotaria socialis]CAF4697073.1 unnamed protein product [Rotaria socialis]
MSNRSTMQQLQVTSSQIHSFQIFYTIDNKMTDFEDIIKKYIRDDWSKIDTVMNEYVKKKGISLFAICNVAGQEDKSIRIHREHWIIFTIVAFHEKSLVFIKDSLESEEYISQKLEMRRFIKEKLSKHSSVEFIEHSNREECTVNGSDISLALNNLNILMKRFELGKEENFEKIFQEIKFYSTHHIEIDFDRLIVETGLNDRFKFRSKLALQKILSALQRAIEKDSGYKLEWTQMTKLTEILESNNFSPRDNDEINLKDIAIDLIIIVKQRGQTIDEAMQKKIKTYFSNNKEQHIKRVNEFNKTLRQDSRNTKIVGCLGLALKDLLKFFVDMENLTPDSLTIENLDMIFKLLGDTGEQKLLEDQRKELENKLNSVAERDVIMDINYKLSDVRYQLDYFVRKSEANGMININDLVILLGNKAGNSHSIKRDILSQETLDRIVELGKITKNKDVALAIIKIFHLIDLSQYKITEKEIDIILDNILLQITQDQGKFVLFLGKKLKLENQPSLLRYMYEILIDNEDKSTRNEAFNVLKSYKYYSHDLVYIIDAIKLEEKYFQNGKTFLSDCLRHVQMTNKLSLNFFERLTEHFLANETSLIINEVVEHGTQQVPRFFVEQFIQYVKLNSDNKKDQSNIISLCKPLLKGQYIAFSHIQNIIEKFIDDTNVNIDIYDLLYIEIINEHPISTHIVDKLKCTAKSSEYAMNLIKLIEKRCSDIDILKNSREILTERKKALNKIQTETQYHTSETIEILQSLVIYDLELRVDCFKVLVDILPQDYTKKDVKIDFIGIVNSIASDKTICLEDIHTLVNKDANIDLSHILTLIIYRIDTDRKGVLSLLSEISYLKVQSKLSDIQILFLLRIAFECTNFDFREKIINILQSFVDKEDTDKIDFVKQTADGKEILCSLAEELNKLQDLQRLVINQHNLPKLRKMAEEEGYAINDDLIKLLIDSLEDPEKQDIHEQISDVLFQIDLRQGFTDITSSTIFDIIQKNLKLISIDSIVGIVTIGFMKRINIPDEVLEGLWQKLSEDIENKTLTYCLVYAIEAFVAQQNQIPETVLEAIANYLIGQNVDIQIRLALAVIVADAIEQKSDELPISPNVIESLKTVTLQPKTNYDEYQLNKVIFQTFKGSIEENNSYHVFLSKYYNIFKQVLSPEKYSLVELKPLDEYMARTNNALEKFHLMNALNNRFLEQQKIDTSIFTDFPENEWRKEILCSDLIVGAFLEMDEGQGIDEFELLKFRENLNLLSVPKNQQNSIENILQELLDKQNTYKLNIEIINEILTMLQSSSESFTILRQKSSNFYIELRELWLSKRLKDFAIESSNEYTKILNIYLPYSIETIDTTLGKVREGTTIFELIHFFYDLSHCSVAKSSIESFLLDAIPYKKSIRIWQFMLIDRLVGSLLGEKFPIYKNYLEYNKLEFNKSSSSQNAYNQATTTYCYTTEDLVRISSEWMREFDSSFRIVIPLRRQGDNKSLHIILTDILNDYKRDRKPTIVSLNIANDHWVTVALVNDKEKDFALYKDSLEEDSYMDEREEITMLLTAQIENIDIKFQKSCDQFDTHNGGIFTLANMKLMAIQLRDKREDFIRNYATYRFTSQKEALAYRTEAFPKMYALSLCQSLKKRKLIDHHSVELKSIREVLVENGFIENELQLSIDLSQEENLLENNYQYLYVITASEDVDFTRDSQYKKNIFQALEIIEVYSAEKNILKVSDSKLTVVHTKKEKLDLTQIIITMNDTEIDKLLCQLSVQTTEFSRDMLKKNLGFAMKENSNVENRTLIDIEKYDLVIPLHRKLTKIVLVGWSIESIKRLIENIYSEETLKHLSNGIDSIYEYRLKEYDSNVKGNHLFDILKCTPAIRWRQEIHALAIFQTFKGSFDKDLEKLKTELYEINKDNAISFLNDEKLVASYKSIQDTYKCKSKLFENCNTIDQWTSVEIKKWTGIVKSTPDIVSQAEKLAVIKRTIEITSKYPPREIQLLSVLILINQEKNTGRLSQINTGEGKTTIVAMLAAMKALEGHKVDVVTSSPELAKPQAKQQRKFFEHFGLTVSDNGKGTTTIKENYRADIVYGAASDFQGDILRDEYSKLGTRSSRKCDVAIVDEVDSMLIDGKNHMVMLSSPMPAMDHLEPLLAAIWIQIEEVTKCIKTINEKTYFIEQEDMLDDNGKIKSDLLEHAIPIVGTKENFVKDCTEKYIRKLIRDKENLPETESNIPSEYPKIEIPTHLRSFVIKSQLIKWIDSAIYAKYRCEHKKHYIIKDRKIAPVDANNTGIVQSNMHWSNGLHQFLQIKHGARISAESLSTNFISNVTYFKRYKQNIYGLTGTLGSIAARQLLSKIYSVDCVSIPSFKQKQYKELTPIIVNNQADEWYSSIVESCMNKLKNDRGVLIITKYIKEVDEIENRLKAAGCDASKIKVYKTEQDSMIIEEHLKCGEIIIATNIAGRGTNIKADKIQATGGLHVCITFLPPNERVEQQNVGRTSRTGNKGTSQFILLEKSEFEFNELRKIRNLNEEDELKQAEIKIKKVLINDAIFAEFCKLLDEIDDKDDPFIKNKNRAVEERFGIWLKMQEDNIAKSTNEEKILEEFKQFRKEILDDKIKKKLIQNPYFHVLIGNQLLEKEKYIDAIKEFSRAIELDENFQANAYYNRGYARIAAYGGNVKKNKAKIEEAISDFRQAKKIIEDNLEPMLHIIQTASGSEALSEQVSHKMTLFGMQKNAIEMAIGADVNEEIEALENQKKQSGINQTDIDNINERIKSLTESKIEREKGIIRQTLDKEYDLEIELLEIEKSLPEDQDINLYQEEISEYKNNGFIGCFRVKEIKPIDWLSVIGLMTLGLAQVVGGAALAVFSLGAGSTIGMGLLSEGISDLITAVKDGIINRDFSWISYGIQKAISLTVSLVCAGLGAIKDAAKTVVAGARQIGSVVTKAGTVIAKNGWKIAAKAIGTELGKGVAKEVVTQLVDYGVNKALMPSIQEEVMKRVEGPLQDALLSNPIVEKMLRLDGCNRNNYYQNLIKTKALELLNPQNKPQDVLITISKGIAKGIASNKIPGLSTVLQVTDALVALDELRTFVPEFIKNLNEAIQEISQNENVNRKIENLNHQQQQQQIDRRSQVSTEQNETKAEPHSIYTSDYIQEKQEDDINLELVDNQEEQISLERKNKSPEGLRQDLAKSVTINMCNIIQNKLVTPVTNAGINFGMKKLTAGLDKSIQDQIGIYQKVRRIEFSQDNDRDNRIPDEFKQGSKDPQALAQADAMIDDIKKGGEAGLPHLGPLTEVIGRPIKVLNEKGEYVRTIGADKGGIPIEVEYHKPTANNPQGHWTLPGGKEPATNNTGKNNCLFNVIAQQTGKDPNQLRADTADNMSSNKANLANQAPDIKWLKQYKNSALTMGGVRLKGNNVYLDDDEIDLIIQTVNNSTYKRMDAPGDFELIDAYDDEGHQVKLRRHHMIPEAEIRDDFTKLVNKYSNDKNSLKTELNKYLNHPNNLIGRQAFIRATGLDKVSEIHENQHHVASSVLTAVSWHPNNIRVGLPGDFRVDDPEAPNSQSKIDYAVADPESKKILDGYAKKKGSSNPVNILDVLNKLPNNVKHYGWKTTIHQKKSAPRIYEVNKSIKIGKFSRFLKNQTGDKAICNPFREGGQRQFRR